MTTALTTTQMLSQVVVGGEAHHVWHGCAGYDTRPYVLGGTVEGFERNAVLPVAYWGGSASNYSTDEEDIEAGAVYEVIAALPVGAVIIIPDYYGCTYEGERAYILAPNGWLPCE